MRPKGRKLSWSVWRDRLGWPNTTTSHWVFFIFRPFRCGYYSGIHYEIYLKEDPLWDSSPVILAIFVFYFFPTTIAMHNRTSTKKKLGWSLGRAPYDFNLFHPYTWLILTMLGGWNWYIPSRELTYPPKMAFCFEDDFPFPKVGYVNSLEGISVYHIWHLS